MGPCRTRKSCHRDQQSLGPPLQEDTSYQKPPTSPQCRANAVLSRDHGGAGMGAEIGRGDRDDAATLLITPRSVRRVGRSRVAPASLGAAMGTTPAAPASPTLQGASVAEHGCHPFP